MHGGEKLSCTTPFRELLRRKESIQHPLKMQQQVRLVGKGEGEELYWKLFLKWEEVVILQNEMISPIPTALTVLSVVFPLWRGKLKKKKKVPQRRSTSILKKLLIHSKRNNGSPHLSQFYSDSGTTQLKHVFGQLPPPSSRSLLILCTAFTGCRASRYLIHETASVFWYSIWFQSCVGFTMLINSQNMILCQLPTLGWSFGIDLGKNTQRLSQ